MTQLLKWLLWGNSARWLIYILIAEYWIAMNLSPTILSDYPALNYFVESMAFIPAVHNFDEIALQPEATRFYIALAILLIIPKSLSIRHWLKKNPIKELRQYVVSPLTDKKPASTGQIFLETAMSEEQISSLPQEDRSMASRIFWSMMILLFTAGMLTVAFTKGYGASDTYVKALDSAIAKGGISMWLQLSLKQGTFSALLVAVSALVIKDYITFLRGFMVDRLNPK